MKNYRYKTILLFASLQFCGNIVEYFSENTQKLIIFYVMPRDGKEKNLVRVYEKGMLVKERKLYSPANLLFCYIMLYINYIKILHSYFSRKESFYVITFHPLFMFFSSLLRMWRKCKFVYWIADYYPGWNLLNFLYRKVSHFYHNHIDYKIYISDRLNKKYNNKIINSKNIKTIMWGIKLQKNKRENPGINLYLCFIGAIRESHGLEQTFAILKERKNIKIKVLGTCVPHLYSKYQKIIRLFHIEKQIYFPNRFIEKLEDETKNCHIGVALYTPNIGTYYADPGKVKTYAQLGLPVLMTDSAEIASFIRKFHAGEIVTHDTSSILEAITKIQKQYSRYKEGIKKFAEYFNYETYYKDRFIFLEK